MYLHPKSTLISPYHRLFSRSFIAFIPLSLHWHLINMQFRYEHHIVRNLMEWKSLEFWNIPKPLRRDAAKETSLQYVQLWSFLQLNSSSNLLILFILRRLHHSLSNCFSIITVLDQMYQKIRVFVYNSPRFTLYCPVAWSINGAKIGIKRTID